jgi:hypothetical protein
MEIHLLGYGDHHVRRALALAPDSAVLLSNLAACQVRTHTPIRRHAPMCTPRVRPSKRAVDAGLLAGGAGAGHLRSIACCRWPGCSQDAT